MCAGSLVFMCATRSPARRQGPPGEKRVARALRCARGQRALQMLQEKEISRMLHERNVSRPPGQAILSLFCVPRAFDHFRRGFLRACLCRRFGLLVKALLHQSDCLRPGRQSRARTTSDTAFGGVKDPAATKDSPTKLSGSSNSTLTPSIPLLPGTGILCFFSAVAVHGSAKLDRTHVHEAPVRSGVRTFHVKKRGIHSLPLLVR